MKEAGLDPVCHSILMSSVSGPQTASVSGLQTASVSCPQTVGLEQEVNREIGHSPPVC